MNTENNNSANALIAEFMGWEVVDSQDVFIDNRFWVDCSPTNEQHPLQLLSEVVKDWNWLMEVVEKIETIKFKLPSQEYGQYKAMKIKDALTMYYNGLTKIEATYNACVEFIKWYNQNK